MSYSSNPQLRVIGRPLPRIEGPDKVTDVALFPMPVS